MIIVTVPVTFGGFGKNIQTSPELVVAEVDAVGEAEGRCVTTTIGVRKTARTTVIYTRH